VPLGKGVRYRVVTKNGKKIRVALKDGEVIEAKNLKTGATHTAAEFKADKKAAKKRKTKRR
jgi:hypothetical protein